MVYYCILQPNHLTTSITELIRGSPEIWSRVIFLSILVKDQRLFNVRFIDHIKG